MAALYRVLLLDDEPWIIEDLKLLVDWRALGFELVGECLSGDEAEYGVKRLKPDLMLSDIRMPGMNGLQLMERLALKLPQLLTIFVTAHGDFDYARTALQQGALDYLLKPIRAADLERALGRARQVLDTRRLERERADSAERTELAFELLEGVQPAEQSMKDYMIGAGYRARAKRYALAIAKGPGCGEVVRRWREAQAGGERGEAGRWLLDVRIGADKWLFIVEEEPAAAGGGGFRGALRRARRQARREGIQVGIGLPFRLAREAKEAYRQADVMAEQDFVTGLAGAWLYRPPLGAEPGDLPAGATAGSGGAEAAAALIAWLRRHRRRLTVESLAHIHNWAFGGASGPGAALDVELPARLGERELPTLYRSFEAFLGSVEEAIIHRGKGSGMEGAGPGSAASLSSACGDYPGSRAAGGAGPVVMHRIIREIVDELERDYTRKHALSMYAERYFLNPNYLSQLFKIETGVAFTQYLLEIRMRKAQALIDGGTMELQEICEYVGYDDYVHFSKQFKKQVGLSPALYKKQRGRPGAGAN